jgi:hypothetical protein
MESRFASLRESIDAQICPGAEIQLFDGFLSLDNDLLLNSKPLSSDSVTVNESVKHEFETKPETIVAPVAGE